MSLCKLKSSYTSSPVPSPLNMNTLGGVGNPFKTQPLSSKSESKLTGAASTYLIIKTTVQNMYLSHYSAAVTIGGLEGSEVCYLRIRSSGITILIILGNKTFNLFL